MCTRADWAEGSSARRQPSDLYHFCVLCAMYISDPRVTAHYEKRAENLATSIAEAIEANAINRGYRSRQGDAWLDDSPVVATGRQPIRRGRRPRPLQPRHHQRRWNPRPLQRLTRRRPRQARGDRRRARHPAASPDHSSQRIAVLVARGPPLRHLGRGLREDVRGHPLAQSSAEGRPTSRPRARPRSRA